MRIKGRGYLSCGAVLALMIAAPVTAHEYEIGHLKVEHPWVRTPSPGETTASLFLVIHNDGDTPDKLTGAASAKTGQAIVHTAPEHIVVPHGVVIPPHSEVKLEPGGPYVGLRDVKNMNPVGWGFELQLTFEKAGDLAIEAAVEAPDATHAHDAEAAERWAKTHPGEGGGASSSAETHPHMHEDEAHHHMPDHHDGADKAAKGDKSTESASDRYQAERNSMDHSKQDFGVPGVPRAEMADAHSKSEAPIDRYQAERNSMDHSKQDFGVPGIPPK
ncbi:MAG: copper chaperone PCu(A)C [Methylocystis sp.]|uniref:copper chaperone PCu(A)C n=1 Tax=Methylocystis sp. TaxID=1911079 RepID=UPI003D14993F